MSRAAAAKPGWSWRASRRPSSPAGPMTAHPSRRVELVAQVVAQRDEVDEVVGVQVRDRDGRQRARLDAAPARFVNAPWPRSRSSAVGPVADEVGRPDRARRGPCRRGRRRGRPARGRPASAGHGANRGRQRDARPPPRRAGRRASGTRPPRDDPVALLEAEGERVRPMGIRAGRDRPPAELAEPRHDPGRRVGLARRLAEAARVDLEAGAALDERRAGSARTARARGELGRRDPRRHVALHEVEVAERVEQAAAGRGLHLVEVRPRRPRRAAGRRRQASTRSLPYGESGPMWTEPIVKS